MTEEARTHQTNVEVTQSSPMEVDAGADIALKVKVSCSSGCDLRGKTIRVVDGDGAAAKLVALTGFEEGINETDEFTVEAPVEVGEYDWSVVFPAQEVGGVLHGESGTSVTFNVKPHSTSMAVWDVPSPIAFGDKFTIKVGVKCSAECNLSGQEIRVYGPRGKKVAVVALGANPWPGTRALYWVEVGLEAPAVRGRYSWRSRFPKPDLELPHEGASCRFTFTAATPPEHVVTVHVISQETKRPLKNANVLLRAQRGYPYRGCTDGGGVATVGVPKGQYTVCASKGDEYETFQTRVDVVDDLTVKAELSVRVKEWWEL